MALPAASRIQLFITVDRKVIEVAGHLHLEAPQNRKRRQTIFPRTTPAGYPLAEKLMARIEEARAEQEADVNPLSAYPEVLRVTRCETGE
jgi:hypothetical protein